MMAGIEAKKRRLILVLLVASLAPHESVSAQTIRFFPIRTAPLGSPVGTVGDPVTPTFNEALDCWELKVPGGVEVDIDLQAFGWGDAVGSPTLGAIQATVISAGYDNGVGAPLNPKGWPDSAGDGAYQATKVCFFGSYVGPCGVPFDPACTTGGGFCIHNPDWVMPGCANDLRAISTRTLDYAWATVARKDCNVDDGEVKTMGGLILEVPPDAAGTYVIAVDPNPNNTFISGGGEPTCCVVKTSACITIIEGACCVGTNSDDNLDSCQENILQTECASSGGLFLGHGVACTGVVGACCLDGDGDGLHDTCREMDSDCCDAQGGSFRGAATTCGNARGACTLDADGDGFQDTCRVMDQTCCNARDGTFRGAGSSCSDTLGACCLDFDRVCVEIDLSNCVEQHGKFQGLKTVCRGDEDGNGSDDACGEVIPAVSEWGLIVMALLLLVGIKICFGRSRRGGGRAWQEV